MENTLDIWTDTISVKDVKQWLEVEIQSPYGGAMPLAYALLLLRQITPLVAGKGISYIFWRPGVAFCTGIPIQFTHDLVALEEEGTQFELANGNFGGGWVLKKPLRYLRLYKENRYPIILQRREAERAKTRERFYTFVGTTKRLESPSAVLGSLEVEGVLKSMFSFLRR